MDRTGSMEQDKEQSRAACILSALSRGVDPFTGEDLPSSSPCQHPEAVRALFHALRLIEGAPPAAGAASRHAASPAEPAGRPRATRAANAGKPWSPEEDGRLLTGFDTGLDLAALAFEHGRSRLAVQVRLAMLGRLPLPEKARYRIAVPGAEQATEAEHVREAEAPRESGQSPRPLRTEESRRFSYPLNA